MPKATIFGSGHFQTDSGNNLIIETTRKNETPKTVTSPSAALRFDAGQGSGIHRRARNHVFSMLVLFLVCFPFAARSQTRVMTITGTPMAIPGGMLMLDEEDGQVIIRRKIEMPGGDRGTVDMIEGDAIIYFEGIRIESLDQLTELYESADVDAEVRLGIERGSDRMIRSFIKPEADVQFSSGNGQTTGMQIRMLPGEGEGLEGLSNEAPWSAGFVIGEIDGDVVVAVSIPMIDKEGDLAEITSGDGLVSLNDQKVTSVTQFNELYESLEVGIEITLVIQREGQENTLSFNKPAERGMMFRMRNE